MRIKTHENDDQVRTEIWGEIDHISAAQLAKKLDEIMNTCSQSEICLDLKNMTLMDSSGIGVLIGRYKRMKRRGIRLTVCNVNITVDRLFRLSGLYQIIKKVG
ncbi:MAG: anti-sigma factor antagonist [Clostridia bacterium]|nr:anti-sigma factor antagonist [Clostridia bacterium]